MAYVNHLLTFIESNPALAVGFNLILLLLSGIFAHLLCKFLLIKVVRKVFFSSHKQDVPLEKDRRIAEKLSNFIPVIIVYYVLQFMPAMPASLVTAINTICGILFFIFMSVFFNEMLDIVNSSYLRKTKRKNHSIKGYIQIGKILVHILAAIMILAVMSNKSPIIIISSLGAVAAVLMIVFQHTLLSLVANVQLSSNDVLQLGDWIEMPDGYRAAHHYHPQLGQYHLPYPDQEFPHRDLYQLAGDVLLRGAADHAQYRHRSALGAFSRPGDALLDADHPRGE